MRSGVRSPSAPQDPRRFARFSRSPSAARARSNTAAICVARASTSPSMMTSVFRTRGRNTSARSNDTHAMTILRKSVDSAERGRRLPVHKDSPRCEGTSRRALGSSRFALAARASRDSLAVGVRVEATAGRSTGRCFRRSGSKSHRVVQSSGDLARVSETRAQRGERARKLGQRTALIRSQKARRRGSPHARHTNPRDVLEIVFSGAAVLAAP